MLDEICAPVAGPTQEQQEEEQKEPGARFPEISDLAHQGGMPMSRRTLTRRQFVAATALSSAALVAAPYVRSANAAGSLSIGFWDHWVPDANKANTALVNEWAEKEKVQGSIDYITSNG